MTRTDFDAQMDLLEVWRSRLYEAGSATNASNVVDLQGARDILTAEQEIDILSSGLLQKTHNALPAKSFQPSFHAVEDTFVLPPYMPIDNMLYPSQLFYVPKAGADADGVRNGGTWRQEIKNSKIAMPATDFMSAIVLTEPLDGLPSIGQVNSSRASFGVVASQPGDLDPANIWNGRFLETVK